MKHIFTILLSVCCLTLAAEHVYPTNPAPSRVAFFGQLNRDSLVVTNAVDGEGRYLPPYLHFKEMDDTYLDEAAEWYAQAGGSYGSCSARRIGGILERNYDWTFNDMPEFVVRIPSGPGRLASLAVCNVGTNVTEADVRSGKTLRWLKALPGHAVDGINECGVCVEVNVTATNGVENWTGSKVHCLGAVRWALDHATNAQHAAEYLAANVYVPAGFGNFHYMICDERETWIVENGEAYLIPEGQVIAMTNFGIFDIEMRGSGVERFGIILQSETSITNVWYTNAYRRETNPPRVSDLRDVLAYTNEIFNAWAAHPKEYFRGQKIAGQSWWQTVHTSVYDITNRTLRVAVQETDDWYTFQVPASGSGKAVDAYTKTETDEKLEGKLDASNPYGTGQVGWESGVFNVYNASLATGDIYANGDMTASGEISGYRKGETHNLSEKANKPYDPVRGNLASLGEYGDLEDSGIPSFIIKENTDYPPFVLYRIDALMAGESGTKLYLTAGRPHFVEYDDDFGVALLDDISADNPHFTNEVTKVVRTLTPPPSPTLRLYDEVRGCWWIGRMVNGVVEWEVE